MTGPSLGELRAASANLMAANFASDIFMPAVKAAADHQQYLCYAISLGFDRETAQRVSDEIAHSGMIPHPEVYQRAFTRLYELLYAEPKPKPKLMTMDDARRIVSGLANCKGGG